ncbi:MAG: porin, partial [Sulfurovum sp.]|nr:porin [Sulfurovum sp.]NNJ45553.1 porin [Sulfurovum sp.]
GTLFMPNIETTITGFGEEGPFTDPTFTSDADINMIPEVSIAHKIDDNWYIGVGMWGTAGLGVDYSKARGGGMNNFNMVTNLQLLQFGVPIAYKTGGLSVAVTPIMQYGNLDIDYNLAAMQQLDPNDPDNRIGNGAGLAQDFGFGYNVGVAYDFTANGVAGLTLGAQYKSAIEMNYDGQLTTALKPFLDPQAGPLDPLSSVTDTLEQPEEYGVGIAYEMGQHTFAFDYKKIKWSSAKGYQDFGWDDSDVYAFGYAYTENEWTVRLGYNHADSAVVEGQDPRLNFFNLLGFPATAEKHYTVGGSYEVTKAFSIDLAYLYLDNTNDTFDISGVYQQPAGSGGLISTDHEENSVSFQLVYTF